MNWFYVNNGQQAGPVDDAQLAELVAAGKIQPDTLIWREGMGNWQPYRTQFPQPATAPGVPGVIGPLSGPGAPPFADAAAGVTEATLLERDYDVDIGACLSNGWQVFKSDAGIIIGATLLVYVAIIAANIVPYLSVITALILNGPLMAGLWLFYLKKIRGQNAEIGDAFGGFSPSFWQLVLTQLIPGLIAFGVFIVLGILAIPAIYMVAKSGSHDVWSAHPLAIAWFGVLALVAIVVVTYLNICWAFALPLVADKGLKFWPALELSRRIVMKHWWMILLLLLVCGVVGAAGFLACGVGCIVTGPLAFAAIATQYQKMFGDLAPKQTVG